MRKKTSPIWLMPKEEFIQLIKSSKSYAEVMSFWKLNNTNNHKTLKARILSEGIDTSHFVPNYTALQQYNNDHRIIPIEEVLISGSNYSQRSLKNRLIKNELIPYKCSICGMLPFWQNKPMILILDHINGVHNDNRLENLRFVCPNCNVQLATNCGKNRVPKKYFCKVCSKRITKQSVYCVSCSNKMRRKKPKVSKEVLEKLVTEKPMTEIGKQFGVSDNAVRKWLKAYNIVLENRLGYWAKKYANKI